MNDSHASFIGAIPAQYDRYLGPLLFEPFAIDLASRVSVPPLGQVLELACGTGILTRRLRDRLPPSVELTATDLNEPMLRVARTKFRTSETVAWEQADAMQLPFPDGRFDAVACQFGLMFFPDKPVVLSEIRRVLRPGGQLVFNVWDSQEENDLARIARRAIDTFFPADPPTFYQTPFSMSDPDALRSLVADAGFGEVALDVVAFTGVGRSAAEAAIGVVEGNPIIAAIRERGVAEPQAIEQAVARAIRDELGDHPFHARTRALVLSARSPKP